VPTATFRVLYCFFVIEHGRRRILHFNVTPHPSTDWVVQQLREAFAEAAPYSYVILDRDSIFNADVIAFLQAAGLEPKRTSIQAPWQNGTAERWIGSCRREILDHIIPVNEERLRRLIGDYVSYYHEDRVHDSLRKDTPNRRPIELKADHRCHADFAATSGRPPSSLHVATSGIESVAESSHHFSLRLMPGSRYAEMRRGFQPLGRRRRFRIARSGRDHVMNGCSQTRIEHRQPC